ncbi:hypothetical protein [Lichenicola sp.]|uniref:hypothetical protein n=1 Tax=Lichenicola sp. TaxID=2804529 RepID=UPI003B00BAB6
MTDLFCKIGQLGAWLSLLVEGWRDVNHSYRLIDQHRLLQMLEMDLRPHHQHLPVYPAERNRRDG